MKENLMAKQKNGLKNGPSKYFIWSFLPFLLLGSWLSVALHIVSVPGTIVELFNDRTAQIIGTESLQNGLCSALQLDGKGQIIGLADSGLDQGNLGQLPLDLRNEPGNKPKIVALQSASPNTVPRDVNGHGTHMAGTIVGSGAASGGKYRGIAPQASLYFQSLADEHGNIRVPEDVSSLFQTAYNAGVRIHVNGWGEMKNYYTARTASVDRFVQEHPDFLAIFSAGNAGPQTGSLSAEANSKNALVVGSSQSARPTTSADAVDTDTVSKTSSAGPTADGRIKPDLLVPSSAVISTASSFIKSNFSANPQYTILGGSSMAAAITGGSAALLTQYLEQEDGSFQPSSALLKTLLIQGARKTSADVQHYGFGILDVTTTILSLQHNCIKWEDQKTVLQQSDARDYYYTVEDTTQPLRVTLSWVDPAASGGNHLVQLVNNLDLEVIAPDGSVYYGNDFQQKGQRDQVNTVEQVVLENPTAGTYTLRIAASLIQTESGQNYAVAYGQNIASQVIEKVENETITLADGQTLDLQNKKLTAYQQGTVNDTACLSEGSQVYWTGDVCYIIDSMWEEDGVQILSDSHGTMLTSINSLARSGGHYINAQWLQAKENTLPYNEEIREISNIPDGAGVQAVINPISQTLYQVQMKGMEAQGKIARIDMENGRLFLQGDPLPYRIASTTAVCYTNTQVEGAPQARPFGYMDRPNVEQLIPGMQVYLLIEEETRQVYAIEAERPTVFAQILSVDAENQTLTLSQGEVYFFTSQTQMKHNEEEISSDSLEPGRWIAGIIRETESGKRELVSLQMMDQIFWGKILYFGESSRSIYLVDQKNQFQDFKLDENILIMRGRAQIRAEAVNAGAWVRVVVNETTQCIERMDIATGVREETAVLAEYNSEQQSMKFTNDAQYTVQDTTLFVREGKVVSVENVLNGEQMQVSILPGNSRSDVYLARVELQPNAGQDHLFTSLEAHYLEDKVVLVGKSYGNTIQIYRADGSLQQLQTEDSGAFAVLLDQQEGETSLLVSAQNRETGEVDIQKIEIGSLDIAEQTRGFHDIVGSLYKQEILTLKEEGILSGYSDGSFRPNEPITRMGFLNLLVRATGEIEVSLEGVHHFKDMQDIPWWGLSTVNTIWKRGWSRGFEDGCIHPQTFLRIKDVQTLLLNCEGGKTLKLPPIQGGYITREEAAVIIYRLIHSKEA